MLAVDSRSAVPLWRQIEEGVQLLVASGALEPGAAVPSVRELAKLVRVNPATVAKAYRRLKESGVLTVRRGEGSFVADGARRLEAVARQRELEVAARRFAATCGALGADRAEAAACLERVWGGRRLETDRTTDGQLEDETAPGATPVGRGE